MFSITFEKCPDLFIALVDRVLESSSGDTNTGDKKKILLLGGNSTAAILTPSKCPLFPRPNLHGNVL